MIKLFTEVYESYENIMTALYKKDTALADKVYIARTELINKCDEFQARNKSMEGSEFIGKLQSIISNTDDINKIIRF